MNNYAYAEVLQIIQYLPEEEYSKIPSDVINSIEETAKGVQIQICDINTNMSEIDISMEAKEILIKLFLDYYATDNQKVKLRQILINREQEKNAESYVGIFEKPVKESLNVQNEDTETMALTKTEEDSIFTKIKKFISRLFHKQ